MERMMMEMPKGETSSNAERNKENAKYKIVVSYK